MPELSNDARTFVWTEDSRATFDIQTGGRSGTPTLEVPVINGNLVEVTCQFTATTDGAFTYEVKSVSDDAVRLTKRPANTFASAAGMQTCVRTDVFLAKLPDATASDDVTFEVFFGADGSATSQAGSFLLTARLVGSSLIG